MSHNDLSKLIGVALVVGPFVLAVAPVCFPFFNGMRRIISVTVSRDPNVMNQTIRRALQWGALSVIICGVILYGVELSLIPSGGTNLDGTGMPLKPTEMQREVHFWFQLFTGNWSSPPDSYFYSPIKMSLSLLLSVVINFLSLGLFSGLIWLVSTLKRENALKVKDLNRVRDLAIATYFEVLLREVDFLSDEQRKHLEGVLDRAVAEGNAYWAANYVKHLLTPDSLEKLDKLVV